MKESKEYLLANNINPTNPNAIRLFKLVEKHPNYEFFFLKSHFGREQVSVEEIERVFRTIQEKNIKISKSVDQYAKYIVARTFEQPVMTDENVTKQIEFKSGEDVTDKYRFIYKENRINLDKRTNFEAFADEVRDSMIKLSANKIIQQFPATGKKVVEGLNETKKREFYFNLNSLLETNTKYVAVQPIVFEVLTVGYEKRIVKYVRDKKITTEEFNAVPSELKKHFNEIIEKPLQAFIKKSARYKSKDALFADLNAALYSLSGDEEYKLTVELIEDTDGAILEGLNPETGLVVASTLNAEAYKKIGGDKTNHCIRNQSTFNTYQRFGGKQYLIINTKLESSDDRRIIGLTIDGQGKITHAHTKSDANVVSSIDQILKKWGITKYVNPMSDDEIIEMLYFVIGDESVFTNEDRAQMVIKYLPQLDDSRYDKRKMINLLRFTRVEAEMKKIIRMSLEMNNSEQFLANYDYLANTILKVVSDDKQAHEMVMNFVKEYNETVGLTKEDCMNMLLNRSKYVQPNRLIEIIGKKKFVDYVSTYSREQEELILRAIPQLFIYFLRDKDTDGSEIKLILQSMYVYEKRDDIRKIVLKRMRDSGHLSKVSRTELMDESGLFQLIEKDDMSIAQSIGK